MLIYKLAGGISLAFSVLLIYVQTRKYTKDKIKQIEGFISFVSYIKNQIECYMMAIDKILASYDSDLLKQCGFMGEGTPISLSELMQEITFYGDEEWTKVIKDFTSGFGSSYRDEQIRSCERCIKELNKAKERMSEKDIKDKKVHLAICICISFSLILILM